MGTCRAYVTPAIRLAARGLSSGRLGVNIPHGNTWHVLQINGSKVKVTRYIYTDRQNVGGETQRTSWSRSSSAKCLLMQQVVTSVLQKWSFPFLLAYFPTNETNVGRTWTAEWIWTKTCTNISYSRATNWLGFECQSFEWNVFRRRHTDWRFTVYFDPVTAVSLWPTGRPCVYQCSFFFEQDPWSSPKRIYSNFAACLEARQILKYYVQNLGFLHLKRGTLICLFSCGFEMTYMCKREFVRNETH